MARYEHLPIHLAAFDLAVHIEKIVRGFSRYHKYSLGTELRERSRAILTRIITANSSAEPERAPLLRELRGELESFKVLSRLCHESGGFASTRAYLHVAELVVGIARQNEGWLGHATKGEPGDARRAGRSRVEKQGTESSNRSGEAG